MLKKCAMFLLSDTYIKSVEAFCNTVEVISVEWTNEFLTIWYK